MFHIMKIVEVLLDLMPRGFHSLYLNVRESPLDYESASGQSDMTVLPSGVTWDPHSTPETRHRFLMFCCSRSDGLPRSTLAKVSLGGMGLAPGVRPRVLPGNDGCWPAWLERVYLDNGDTSPSTEMPEEPTIACTRSFVDCIVWHLSKSPWRTRLIYGEE